MNKRNVVCYIIVLCYSFLICYNFLTPKLATDTYNIINIGLKEYAIQNSLTDGRLIMGGILLLINIIPNIEIEFLGTIFEFLAIIISCFVVLILYNITLNKKTSKIERIFNLICSYFIVFNFAYIENLYFMECFVMSLSLLFYLLSAKENISRNYLLSAIFLFLGLISYQGTISFYFTILLFLIIINEEKELKKRI